ncbi:MAG: hypothetical protein ACI4TB_10310 [Lachnospiraceae bacterium]
MKRIGKSPDKFTTILTDDEYRYFFWKQQVSHAQMKKDWKQVWLLLEREEAREWNCNPVIQEQFYLLMQGIVQEKLFGNREKSVSRRMILRYKQLSVVNSRMSIPCCSR